jgi:hypothetical protein
MLNEWSHAVTRVFTNTLRLSALGIPLLQVETLVSSHKMQGCLEAPPV